MDKNLKEFVIKMVIFGFLLFVVRALFQVPVEYFRLRMFYEDYSNRLFSKGDAMKVIVLSGIVFTMYFRSTIERIAHSKVKIFRSLLLFVIANLFVVMYYALRYVTNQNSITAGAAFYGILLLKGLSLALSGFFLLISVFQWPYLVSLWKHLSKPIMLTALFTVVFYFLLMFFQEQWRFFSQIVADNLVNFFRPFYNVTVAPGNEGSVINVEGFSVAIGAACSGIDSMLLFFALFIAIFALDYKDIKKTQFVIALALGLLGDFIVNNIRVFLLILVGVHISPQLAVGLFHTHAGWIMFLIYFVPYFWLAKKFIYKAEGAKK